MNSLNSKMPVQYCISAMEGFNLKELLETLSKEVTLHISMGATLVGGHSITIAHNEGPFYVVSQAFTINKE